MKSYFFRIAFTALLASTAIVYCNAQSLSLLKNTYSPGEKILVKFTASSQYPEDAWVGIIPSSVSHGSEVVNDQNDITYQYLKKVSIGMLTFTAPEKPGQYDIRMNDSDNGGKEVASVTFWVGGEASLSLEKLTFSPGEKIVVSFTGSPDYKENAWIGIIPSNVEHGSEARNDQVDLTYQYMNKQAAGTMVFTAPNVPGSYDFRMNDSDDGGKEVASVTFTVGASSNASLTLERYEFRPGESIRVSFSAPSEYPDNAWVGIIPSNVEHGSEARNDQVDLTYQYLSKKTSGVLIFTAPTNLGKYDFRMNDNDNGGKEVASVSFTVQ